MQNSDLGPLALNREHAFQRESSVVPASRPSLIDVSLHDAIAVIDQLHLDLHRFIVSGEVFRLWDIHFDLFMVGDGYLQRFWSRWSGTWPLAYSQYRLIAKWDSRDCCLKEDEQRELVQDVWDTAECLQLWRGFFCISYINTLDSVNPDNGKVALSKKFERTTLHLFSIWSHYNDDGSVLSEKSLIEFDCFSRNGRTLLRGNIDWTWGRRWAKWVNRYRPLSSYQTCLGSGPEIFPCWKMKSSKITLVR